MATMGSLTSQLSAKAHKRRSEAFERTQRLAMSNYLLQPEELRAWLETGSSLAPPPSNPVAVIRERRPRLPCSTAVWENSIRCHSAVSPLQPSPAVPQCIQNIK